MYKEIRDDEKITTKESLYESVDITESGNITEDTSYFYNSEDDYHESSSVWGYTGYYGTFWDNDYSLSSSYALFDITFGIDSASNSIVLETIGTNNNTPENKYNIYKNYQQELLGSTETAFKINDSTIITQAAFISFRRNIYRDAIKPGVNRITLQNLLSGTVASHYLTLVDATAGSNLYKTHLGSYSTLYNQADTVSLPSGLIFYDAGIMVISASAFPNESGDSYGGWTDHFVSGNFQVDNEGVEKFDEGKGPYSLTEAIQSGTLSTIASATINHIGSMSLGNRADIYSEIISAQLGLGEGTYSANSTFIDDGGKIRTAESGTVGEAKYASTYVTAVGLYDPNGTLLGIAKLAYPVPNSWQNIVSVRVKIDH